MVLDSLWGNERFCRVGAGGRQGDPAPGAARGRGGELGPGCYGLLNPLTAPYSKSHSPGMERKEYYRRWRARAFKGTWGQIQFWVGLTVLMLSPVALVWKPWADLERIYPAVFFLLLGGVILGRQLAITSYEMYKEALDELDGLKEATRPRLAFEQPIIVREGDIHSVRIKIANEGGEFLNECLIKLERIEPLPSGWSQHDLPVALPTERQAAQGRTGRFKLGPNDHKFVRLFSSRIDHAEEGMVFITEEGEKRVPIGTEYKLILIAGAELGMPIRYEFHTNSNERNLPGISCPPAV